MKLIQGDFGNKKPKEDRTIKELFEDAGILDKVPSSFVAVIEFNDEVYTISSPLMSMIEIFGFLETHKVTMMLSTMMGTTTEEGPL